MNSWLRISVTVFLLTCSARPGHAQAATSHVISFPKGDAAWTITFEEKLSRNKEQPPAESAPTGNTQPGVIQKIEIVRMKDLRRDTVSWADGTKGEFWWPQKTQIVIWKKQNEPIRAMSSGYFEQQKFDISAFNWVNEKTFAGQETLSGKKCRHYRMDSRTGSGDIITYQAWIDEETNRPVGLQVGGGRPGIFTYDNPLPEKPLVLEGEYAATLQKCEQALAPRKSFGR